MRLLAVFALLLLSACGAARELQPAQGRGLPDRPYGATATPTAKQLSTASPQARPGRSDELLQKSEERRGDTFDLPPPN